MGTLLYVLLILTRVIDLPYDLLILCFLLSLDSVAASIFYLGIKMEKRARFTREPEPLETDRKSSLREEMHGAIAEPGWKEKVE